MPLLKIQLNHPGNEMSFKIGKGYHKVNDLIIREWNDEKVHFRKFIRNEGNFLAKLDTLPLKSKLLFWGEWEGNSIFTPFEEDKGKKPNGIHVPFHSILNRGCQNTDSYVYGDNFKYATCSQSGKLTKLDSDSLILFGTTKDNGFELDTVFVVKENETAQNVLVNNGLNYTKVYFEETLVPLIPDYYNSGKNIYHGQTWWGNKDYFSFVPCKIDNNIGFQKALLQIPPMSKQKVGHPYKHLDKMTHLELWKHIVAEVLNQGFCLGIRFSEPVVNDEILKGIKTLKYVSKSNCNKGTDRVC